MATYPSAIIVLTNPAGSTLQSDPAILHSVQHQNANDEIEAIETELGTLPKGSYTDVKTRLDAAIYNNGTQSISGTFQFNNNLTVVGGLIAQAWMELGSPGGASTPFIDFHSGAVNVDYDSRIIASGGNGTVGKGSLAVESSSFVVNGSVISNPALVANSPTGQTNNIQEWRVNNAILAAVHFDGAFHTPALTDPGGSGPYQVMGASGIVMLNRTTVSNTPLTVRGMTGQTGVLTLWTDVTGAATASLDATGVFRGTALARISNTGPYINTDVDAIRINNRTSVSNVPLIVSGMPSQSAALQLWMDGTNATAAWVGATGAIMTRNVDSFRSAPAGGTGVIQRNDGTSFYILLTAGGDPDGTWNALRPFSITLSTGRVQIGNGLDLTGNMTITSTIAASALAGSLLSTATPLVAATTGLAGTATIPSRQDHVHPYSSAQVLLTGAQTLSGKTLTSPVLSSPSFTGTVSGGISASGSLGMINGVHEIVVGFNGGGGLSIAQDGPGGTHTNGVILWVSGNSLYGRHSNGADSFIN